MPSNPCAGRQWTEATRPFRAACAATNAPCALCGQPIDYRLTGNHKRAFTVDHIIARWAGGPPLDPTNWQPAHRTCNSSRGAKETNTHRAMNRPKPIYFQRRTELTW